MSALETLVHTPISDRKISFFAEEQDRKFMIIKKTIPMQTLFAMNLIFSFFIICKINCTVVIKAFILNSNISLWHRFRVKHRQVLDFLSCKPVAGFHTVLGSLTGKYIRRLTEYRTYWIGQRNNGNPCTDFY